MATRQEVTFVIRARDLTRTAFGRVKRSIASVTKGLRGLVGAFSVGLLVRGIVNVKNKILELDAAVIRTGVNADRLKAFEEIFRPAGLGQEQTLKFFDQLARARSEALAPGGGDFERTLQQFGITAREIKNGNLDVFIGRIADALNADVDNVLVDELNKLFGEEGPKFAVALRQGSGPLFESVKRLEKLNLSKGLREQVDTARKLEEETAKLEKALNEFLSKGLPAITLLVESINALIAKTESTSVGDVVETVASNLPGPAAIGAVANAAGLSDDLSADIRNGINQLLEFAKKYERDSIAQALGDDFSASKRARGL